MFVAAAGACSTFSSSPPPDAGAPDAGETDGASDGVTTGDASDAGPDINEGLLAFWRFDEMSTQTVLDDHHIHDGTIVGTVDRVAGHDGGSALKFYGPGGG